MRKSFAKEIKAELEALKAGEVRVEVCPEKEAQLYRKPRRGYRSVELPSALVTRLEKMAKNRNTDIGEVIKTLAKGQK